ncbi:MAG: hypothetical protein ABJH04_10685 [Cyclobacteriaceae bacterium]
MSSAGIRVRPRFKMETLYTSEQLLHRLKEALNKEDAPCTGQVHSQYATIYIPHKDQHYWSPQLTLTLEETENGSILRGLYGPRPVVWTMFIFFYSLIGVAILFIGVMGLSYYSLGKPTTLLWLIPILAVVFLTLWLVAYFGQKLGHDQMVILHEFIEKSVTPIQNN